MLTYHGGPSAANLQSLNFEYGLRCAGVRRSVVDELRRRGVRCASDLIDWPAPRLLRLPHVGKGTAAIIAAFVEAQ